LTNEDDLFAELTWLAQRLGWSLDQLLDLEHPLRRRFIAELDRIESRAPHGG
jgi:uncharacterized protein DUF6760